MGKVGYSSVAITPPVGSRMGGYSGRVYSKGVHDDLYARALYISDDKRGILLISTDLVGFFHMTPIRIRKLISRRTGFPYDAIFVHAIHNHAGFDTMGIFDTGGMFFKRTLEFDKLIEIEKKIALAGIKALKEAKNAKVAFASTFPDKKIAIDRRKPDRLVKYPINVIKFEREDTDIYLVNYAMHATVLPRTNYLFSADYPGYLVRWFEERGYKAIYVNGPCGNVNPYLLKKEIDLMSLPKDIREKLIYEYPGTFEDAKRIGFYLAEKAYNAVKDVEAEEISYVNYKRLDLRLPLDYWSAKKSVSSKLFHDFLINLILTIKRLGLGNWVYSDMHFKGGSRFVNTEIIGARINDIYLGGLPAEFFVEYYDKIKRLSEIEKLILIELTNDSLGYVPNPEDLGEGGYEETLCFVPAFAKYGPQLISRLLKNL